MYPVLLEPDDNGTLLVTCPDLPEVTSWGEDRDDALQRAADAIEEALAARIARRDRIPAPSKPPRSERRRTPEPIATLQLPVLPALTVAKVALYRAAFDAGVSKAELARRLGWHAPQIDRLFDLRHHSRLEQIEQGLHALGKRLVLDIRNAA